MQETQEMQLCSLGGEDLPGDWIGNPLQYSCLENLMERGACWAKVHGVPKELDTADHAHMTGPLLH